MRKFNETVELPLSNSNKKQSRSRAMSCPFERWCSGIGILLKEQQYNVCTLVPLICRWCWSWKAGVWTKIRAQRKFSRVYLMYKITVICLFVKVQIKSWSNVIFWVYILYVQENCDYVVRMWHDYIWTFLEACKYQLLTPKSAPCEGVQINTG